MLLNRVVSFFKYIFLCLALLLIIFLGGVNLPISQRFITEKANKVFSDKKLPVHVDRIRLLITGRLGLSGVEIIGSNSDTIIYAGDIKVSVKLVPLIFHKVKIMGVTIDHATVNIFTDKASGRLNIISIFSSLKKPSAPKPGSGKKWDISIGSVYLNNVKFDMIDSFNGIHISQAVNELTAVFEKFSLTGREISASYISVKGAEGDMILGRTQKIKTDSSSSDAPWVFKLKDSDLRRMHFTFSQPLKNQELDFKLAGGIINNASVDLVNHKIRVSRLDLENPVVQTLSNAPEPTEPKVISDNSSSEFPGYWDISGKEIKISGGTFQTGPYPLSDAAESGFTVTSLNSWFSDVRLSSIKSQLNIDDLSFSLSNGFRLEKGQFVLKSDSAQGTTLRATLRTSQSHLSLLMESRFELSDLISSYSSAPFALKVDDAEFSSGDFMSFFSGSSKNKQLKGRKDLKLALRCDVSGTAGNMRINNMDLKTGKGISLSLSGDIEGIRDPLSAKCSVSLKAGPVTPENLREILSLTGSESNIPEFDPVSIEGSVDSTLKAPRFRIAIESHSGIANMDGNINLSDKSYGLLISGSHVDLGKISGIEDLGFFTGILNLSGKEFNPGKMKFKASLDIDTIGYKAYNYSRIKINSNGDKGLIVFNLNADDPYCKFDLEGSLNLIDSLTGGQVKGLLNIDAGRINLYKGVSLSTALEAGFNKKKEGLLGFASVKNLSIRRESKSADLQNLEMSFSSSDTLLHGKISADFLKADGYYEGSADDLINVFKEGRFRGIALLDSAVSNRAPYLSIMDNMVLSLEASYDPFIGLLVSDTIFSYQKIYLKIMKDSTGLAATDLSVDKFNLGKSRGYNASLALKRNPERTWLVLRADSLRYGDVSLTGLDVGISSAGDSAKISLYAGDTKNVPLYDIEAIAYKSRKEIIMTTSMHQWVINGYNWEVAPGDFLILEPGGRDLIAALHLKNDLHSIDIYGRKSEKLSFECKDLGLKMLLVPGMKNSRYDAVFTGKVEYTGGLKSEITALMNIDSVKLNDDLLGDIKMSGKYQSDTTGNFETEIDASMNDSTVVKLKATYGINPGQRRLNAEFRNLPLIAMGTLSRKYISDLQGVAGGTIELKPVNGKSQIGGEISVSDIGLKLIPVNSRFYLPGDIIKITDNRLLFNNFTVLDSSRNRLDLNGSVDLSDLNNIIADLRVTSNRIQVMNTTSRDNPEFNGSVFIDSRITLSGPLQKPLLQGSLVLAEGTIINYRYTENLAVSETQKMINFASLSEEKLQGEKKKSASESFSKTPDIEATVEINPGTLFNFEISKGFDIGVHISGGGFLTYSLMPNKVMDLTGMYEIRQGASELKIPGWPRKDFVITPGSFVKWDGKVDDPDLRVETNSRVRGSYINPIDQKNREVNFNVYMKLAGRLSQIDIIFDVRSEDQYLTSVFNTMSGDERMKQAINLLIFGSVQLPNAGGSSDYMTQQINQFWESQINSFTKSAVKFVDLSMGIDSYKDPAKGGTEHTSVSVQVKKDLFKDRGSVMVSGRMNDNSTNQQSNAVIENFIFEYALDSIRSKYLKVYRQQNYEDLLEGEVIKSGIGFIYRKSYDKVSDIWRKEKKTKSKK